MPLGSIINMQPKPSFGAALGAGIGEGIGQTGQMMVNQKLTEMLQQKQLAMQHAEWYNQGQGIANLMTKDPQQRKMIAADIGAVGPDNWMKYMEMFGNTAASQASGATVPSSATQATPSKTPQAEQQQNIPGITSPDYAQGQGGQANAFAGPQVPNIMGLPNRGVGGQPIPGAGQQMPEPEQPQAQGRQLEPGKYVAPQLTDEEFEASLAGYTNKQKDAARKNRKELKNLSLTEEKLGLEKEKFQFTKESKTQEQKSKKELALIKRKDVITKDLREGIEKSRESLDKQREGLQKARYALESGETEGFVQFIATQTGFDPLKTPETAILLNASKDFLKANVGSFSSKAQNLYLEKTLKSMYPAPGQTKQAGLSLALGFEKDFDIEEKRQEAYDKLNNDPKYLEKPTELNADINKIVSKYREERNKQYLYDLQDLKERFMTSKELLNPKKVIPGTYLTKRMALIIDTLVNQNPVEFENKVKDLGYILPEKGVIAK